MVVEEIEKLIVRINRVDENSKSQIVGSGVLWRPAGNPEHDYVFTAAHVVETRSIYEIELCGLEQEVITQYVEPQDVAIHQEYDVDNKTYMDVAVLKCPRLKVKLQTYDLKEISTSSQGVPLIIKGFPCGLYNEQSFNLSRGTVSVFLSEKDDSLGVFHYILSAESQVNPVERNEELVGYSGSGVFEKSEDRIALVGIHSHGIGDNNPQGRVAGIYIKLVREICQQRGWDVPRFESEINGSLSDRQEFFEDGVQASGVVSVLFTEMLHRDYSMCIQSEFCGTSRECKYGTAYHRCPDFRGNLLIIATILKYIDDSIDLTEPVLTKDDQIYPIIYLCSEGVGSIRSPKVSHLKESLKSDYLCRHNVKENSIIIWGSEKASSSDKDLILTRKEFKMIINDIRSGVAINRRGMKEFNFNAKTGISIPQEIAIIHINKIIEWVNDNDMNLTPEIIRDIIVDNSNER